MSRRAGTRSALLVTGGAGFIGCNLADRLASMGYRVLILDSLTRPGVEANLAWLLGRHAPRVEFMRADVRDRAAVDEAVGECQGVFHLAAQVAVTDSLADPRADLSVNLVGTLNVLEAARAAPSRPPVLFASTNKVYGNLGDLEVVKAGRHYRVRDADIDRHGIPERRRLSFHTPYGCSKGAADQYVLDYAATFGLRTACLRMSCIYGPHQCGTEDQGWVAHFARCALAGEPIRIYGDGCQVRDVLYIDDAVEAWVRLFRTIDRVSGRALNLGGGPANAVSLLQVIDAIVALTGRSPEVTFHEWRPGDQRVYVSDIRAISAALDLPPPGQWQDGLAHLVAHLEASAQGPAAAARIRQLEDAAT